MIRLIIRTRLTLTKTGQKPDVNPSIYNSMCSLDFGDDLFFLYLTCVHLSIYLSIYLLCGGNLSISTFMLIYSLLLYFFCYN